MGVQEMVHSVAERVASVATVNTVFGDPKILNGRAIIPIAMVAGGFGAGGESLEDSEATSRTNGGGGGGYGVRPIAILEVSDSGTRLIPVMDTTKIVLAGIGLLGGFIWTVARICRSKRR